MLLLCGLVCVSTGWIWERHHLKSKLIQQEESCALREEQIFVGSTVYCSVFATVDTLEQLELDDDPEHQQYVKTELVSSIIEVYEHQVYIDHIRLFDARLLTHRMLRMLDCESTEGFFEMAKSVDSLYNLRGYETEQEDRDKLSQYITRVILDEEFKK